MGAYLSSLTSIIYEDYSWSRLQITQQTYEKILRIHGVFSCVLDYVRAFGIRFDDDSNIRNDYQISLPKSPGTKCPEICYNIQYVEKHGRSSGYPWSLRQVGVYQKHDLNSHRSRWILLHPSSYIRDEMERWMKNTQAERSGSMNNVLRLHPLILFWTSRNWTEYIEDHRSELKEIVRPLQHPRYSIANHPTGRESVLL